MAAKKRGVGGRFGPNARFVDALREYLGKVPLYRTDWRPQVERFGARTYPWPMLGSKEGYARQ